MALENRRLLSSGELDPLFGAGGTGKQTLNFGDNDTANAVAVQADGKIVVAGSWDGGSSDFALARYNPNGTLDTTFGGGTVGAGSGRVNITFGLATFGGAEFATGVAIDSSGRIVVVGYTNNVAGVAAHGGNDMAIARLTPTGALDTTFSGDGKLTVDIGVDDRATAVAIQPFDGKIVVGGYDDGGSSDISTLRINTDGSLDTTFGAGGKSVFNFGLADFATSLALDSNGKIVIAGYTNLGASGSLNLNNFLVARLTTAGALDTTFNGTGKASLDFGGDDRATAVAIDQFGSIVVAGKWDEGKSDMVVARYTAAGALDTNFGSSFFGATSGKSDVYFGTSIGSNQDFCTGLSLRPDGTIVLTGYTDAATTANDFAIAQLTYSGTLDTRFDGDGRKTIDFGADDRALAVATTSDGSIITVGATTPSSGLGDFAIARLRGALDIGFGAAGETTTDWGDTDTANAVAIQPDGKLVVAGSWDGTLSDFAIARYTAAGVLDTTFGGGTRGAGSGLSNVTFGLSPFGAQEFATDVAIDSLGRIVVVGYTDNVNGVATNGNDFAIARLTPSGALDTSFNGTGKLTIDFGGDDRANSIVIRPDGRILVAGSWDGGQSEMVVASINPNGTLDSNFGDSFFGIHSGKTNVFFGADINSGQDFCTDAVLQPNGKLILAGYSNAANGYTSTSYDFAVARINIDGSTDTTYGTAGKTLIDLGASAEQATAIALQSDGKVVVTGYTDTDFGVVRLTAAGLLDTTFAGGSGYESIPWGYTEAATDVAIQPDGKILLAGYTNSVDGSTNDAAVMRLNPNGSFDQTFSTAHNLPDGYDTGERVIVDFGGVSQGLGMALQSNGQIVLAGTNNGDFAVARLTPVTSAGTATFEYETTHRVVVQMSSTTVGLTASDFVLQNLTTGITVSAASIAGAFSPDSSRLILTFPGFTNGILPDGNYRLTLPAGTYTDTAGNPNSTAFSSDFWFLNGDANRDRIVNFADLVILAQDYNQTGRTFSQGNLDYSADGKVSFGDLVILAQRYGTVLGLPALTAAGAWPLAGGAGGVPKHGKDFGASLKELA